MTEGMRLYSTKNTIHKARNSNKKIKSNKRSKDLFKSLCDNIIYVFTLRSVMRHYNDLL